MLFHLVFPFLFWFFLLLHCFSSHINNHLQLFYLLLKTLFHTFSFFVLINSFQRCLEFPFFPLYLYFSLWLLFFAILQLNTDILKFIEVVLGWGFKMIFLISQNLIVWTHFFVLLFDLFKLQDHLTHFFKLLWSQNFYFICLTLIRSCLYNYLVPLS